MGEVAKIRNQEVADIFYEIADLLELQGVKFKPQAYRKAAQSIQTLSEDITAVYERDELSEIPGVGTSIALKIQEILEKGDLEYLEKLRKEIPQGLRELTQLEGVGPKIAFQLYDKLKISSIEELELSAKQGKLRELKGFKEKTEENILKAIEMYRSAQGRFLLGDILPIAEELEKPLKNLKEVTRITIAGSLRRRKETIGDLDFLVVSVEPLKVMDYFTELPVVKRVLAKGPSKSSVVLSNNLQVDLRVVEEKSFGSALQYFTGSKEHNVKLRKLAIEKNWKLSEYNLLDKETKQIIAGENEEDIYKALELSYIEPELREDRGEIEAALKGKLPHLVTLKDVKGDLQVHTKWSDGINSLEEMIEAARLLNYDYVAITDHSKGLQVAHGLTEVEVRKQMREIDVLNRKMEDITILCGIETNIDSNGKLDISNDVLRDLDIVVAAVHSGFKQSEEKMTERILTAMHNDYVNVIAHPTGRLINKRGPYPINLPEIFETASKLRVILEINAFPNRLDLSDLNCFKARTYGTKFSIATDAHHTDHFTYMELGVSVARRGWLEKKDIINTLNLKELRKILERK
ncbi:MAG: DNA polymerase/3'-5' exonuclease PolX [Promethearchaeota archaeon]